MSRLTRADPPRQRTLLALVIVGAVLLSTLAPFVGVAAGQPANTTNTTNTTTAPTATTTGAAGSASGGNNTTGQVPPGLLQKNESWDEFANRSGSINVTARNNSSSGGGGGGGGGLLSGPASFVGGVAGGAYDIAAGLGDFLGGSTDEWLGGFTKGAKAFFSWMLGFFVKQAMGILAKPLNAAVEAITMTPHANNVGSYYTPPSNSFQPLYQTFQEVGQPAAWLIWLVSVVTLIGFGNYCGIGMIDRATERQSAVGLAVGAFFLSDFSWVVANVFLHTLDLVGESVTVNIQSQLATVGFSGMVVVLVLIMVYFEAFAAVFLLAIAAFRIEFIMALTPFFGALVIARVSPIKGVSSLSNFALQLWGILAVAGVPAAFLLDAAFSMAQMALAGKLSALGTMMAVPMILGGIVGAALMPFLLLKGRNKMFSGTFGVPGLSQSGEKMRGKMDEYQKKAARTNRFQRGFRGKDPIADDGGTRSHRAGAMTRSGAGKVRSGAGKASSAAGSAAARAAHLKQGLNQRNGGENTSSSDDPASDMDGWTTMQDKLDQKPSETTTTDDDPFSDMDVTTMNDIRNRNSGSHTSSDD